MESDEGYFAMDDGVRLYRRSLGAGPTVVIPNGLYFLEDLAPLGERWRLVAYDPRNRGRSDAVADAGGIDRDVADLETVREALEVERLTLIGHSYVGWMIAHYARRFPRRVRGMVQIAPLAMDPREPSPPAAEQAGDPVTAEVLARLAVVQRESEGLDPQERCERLWSVLRRLYVTEASDQDRIRWGRCDLPNERAFLRYWRDVLLPSIQRNAQPAEAYTSVTAPVLVVHGKRDRSSPFAAGREWAATLPNGRLLALEQAGHAPWIEAPTAVLGEVESFLAELHPSASGPTHASDP